MQRTAAGAWIDVFREFSRALWGCHHHIGAGVMIEPKETQYAACHAAEPVTLGPMASEAYRRDPKRLGFTLARYKFVSKMLTGFGRVAEIGCGDGFGSTVVEKEVKLLNLFDFDEAWKPFAEKATGRRFQVHDIVKAALDGWSYEAIYMLDVIEHIAPADEATVMHNIARSLDKNGVLIIGTPSLESQPYASAQSARGHVNCKSGEKLRSAMLKNFGRVFMFGMNDEMVHVGFMPMCQYLFAVCVGRRETLLSWDGHP